jgi:hypothetical protein
MVEMIRFAALALSLGVSSAVIAADPPKPEPPKTEEKKPGGKFGLSGLNPLGREKSNDQTVASAGSRGVNPDRDAKGGPNSSPVPVKLTPAEVAAFRKGIA